MNLSISNLSWACPDSDIFPILKKNNVKKIELSLTKQFGDWDDIQKDTVVEFKKSLDRQGLEVSSIQSIFYQKDYNLFTNTSMFIEHFKKVLDYCELLECKYVVFGSPKIRKPGNIPTKDSEKIFIDAFSEIADYNEEIMIGIETNPKVYGCEYITNYEDCKKILQKLDKNNVKFHLDTACVSLENDDPLEIFMVEKSNLKHIHLSCKNLQTIYNDNTIESILEVVAKNSLNTCLSIEMLRIDKDEIDLIFQKLNNVLKIYSNKTGAF